MPVDLNELRSRVERAMLRDRHGLRRRLRAIRDEHDVRLERLVEEIELSVARRERRAAGVPRVTYPPDLPVVQKRDEIAAAIREHQVIVLCGETGSGKTTQLPKICLELGRGVAGMIGHTQPRRIAARTVAARIAEELQTPLGQAVGYKVRFSDKLSDDTYIKLMTDGILLAETQGDRFLEAYDTIIIDEAHERSLNIDFLLGYLKQLLPRRPDLKVIITSATIDPERFSRHFDNAPIVMVSGRTYPVETRYRPIELEDPDEDEPDLQQAILSAVDELWREGPGDMLIFLSGEREIRETAESLRRHHPPETEILPLYARLSFAEQQKVFKPTGRRRIVLATNVAETSLTVPGIRYVIDPGFARISRYAPRTRVQRLPIEPISRASADQRKGRCGRVSEGICIRLYSEEDYNSRPQFTDPEILRTNLAAVILQMKALRLGRVEEFPFIDPPDGRQIRDGYLTLHEIGAIDDRNELTDIGWALAKLPIDPRIGRMILQGAEENVLDDVLILAAALSIQDPRERPMDKADAADQAHARFRDENSDFVAFLNLWNAYNEQTRHLSSNKLRKWCQENFVSSVRMREWHDIHSQLREIAAELELPGSRRQAAGSGQQGKSRQSAASSRQPKSAIRNPQSAMEAQRYDAIHRSLLAGLLSNIGTKTDQFEYTGARHTKFHIFPGSGLFKSRPQWVMAAELVETTKLYARIVARIRPEWAERLGEHLVKRSYSDPHWNRQTAHVTAYEKVTLFGLTLVPRRSVHYGPIDPKQSREIFIRSALVEGDYDTTAPYFRHNQKLVDEINTLEAKRRNRDVLVDEQVRFDFYDARIPAGVHNGPAFEKWRRAAEPSNPRLLFMNRAELMRHAADDTTAELYPDVISVNGVTVPLLYHFEPGHPADGITARIPLAALNQVDAERFEWLVPGLLREKITALIKSLPKTLRVNFVPAPDWAAAAEKAMPYAKGSLYEALATFLSKGHGITVRPRDFDPGSLLDHLHMNFQIVDDAGKELAVSRDLAALRRQFGIAARQTFESSPPMEGQFNKDGLTRWDFGDLPESVEVKRNGMTLRGYPAIEDRGDSVSLRLFDTPQSAAVAMRGGLRRLFILQTRQEIAYIQRMIRGFDQLSLQFATIGTSDELKRQIAIAAADQALYGDKPSAESFAWQVRTREQFAQVAEDAWKRLNPAADQVTQVARDMLAAYHNVALQLQKTFPPLLQPSIEDIRRTLSRLVPRDFLIATPAQWLVHLPRFLKAVEIRLRKLLNAGLKRDQQAMAAIAPYLQRYRERLAAHRKQGIVDPALEHFRWMIEELHVSLFAQELKTSQPVSPKRLDELWMKVEG